MGSMRVLVVDDHVDLASIVATGLRREGMAVDVAFSGEEALRHAAIYGYEVIVLDRDLPDVHGDRVCETLVERGQRARVLMLTASGEIEDRVAGLSIGADDYLAKPFEPRELALRVANILKRARPPAAAPVESVRFGPFVYHLARGELRKGDDVIRLTDREREMLRVLTASVGETVPRQALAGSGEAVSERTVDVQVNRLRRKIERDPSNPLIVQTVRGVGYRLVASA
jgi:two-component system, OmpR family, phosphate regulon response regulator OmpR